MPICPGGGVTVPEGVGGGVGLAVGVAGAMMVRSAGTKPGFSGLARARPTDGDERDEQQAAGDEPARRAMVQQVDQRRRLFGG